MGILDRYPDWKEKDEGGQGHYRPEQPSYGKVLPSLMKLKTKEHFYQKTVFKMILIVAIILLILYYLLPNLF